MKYKRVKIRIILLCILLLAASVFACSCNSAEKELARLTEIIDFRLPESKYTAASYAEYKDAYNAAVELYSKENITVLEIDRVVDRVNAAKNKLVEKNDFSELIRQIDIFKAIVKEEYAPSTYARYQEAYERAEAVLAVDTSSQSDINAAAEDLDNAKKALQILPDTSALERLLAVKVDESLYTGSSYAKYQNAVENARRVLAKECPSIEELKHAEIQLTETYSELVPRGNSDELRAYVRRIKTEVLINDAKNRPAIEHFTKTSYNNMMRALSVAEKLLNASDASETEYRDQEQALKDAENGLIDISALIDAYDEAGKYAATLERGEYTAESYRRLSEAMDLGYQVRNDADAEKSETEEATRALIDAMDRMEHVTISPDGRTDKDLSALTVKIDGASVTVGEYMTDYTVFLNAMFNSSFAFNPDGEAIVFSKSSSELRVSLFVDRLYIEYTGKAPVAEGDLRSFSLGGLKLNSYVLAVVGDTGLGSPTNYEAGKLTVDGRQKNTATLTYRSDEAGVTLIIRLNIDDSYILSVDIDGRSDR